MSNLVMKPYPPFDERKAAAAAGYLLKRAGGRVPYMKLVKLLYLADRESFNRFNRPITGGKYVAMRLGPVISEVLNHIKSDEQWLGEDGPWAKAIGRENYDVFLKAEPDLDPLSDGEIALLDEVWALFEKLDQYRMSHYTHRACPEWKDPGKSAFDITIDALLRALGKSDEEIETVCSALKEQRYFDRLFG